MATVIVTNFNHYKFKSNFIKDGRISIQMIKILEKLNLPDRGELAFNLLITSKRLHWLEQPNLDHNQQQRQPSIVSPTTKEKTN